MGDQIHVGALVARHQLRVHRRVRAAHPLRLPARLSGLAGARALLGAAIGVVALTAINILRIAFLVRVAEVAPDLFAYFHEYVWQGVFLVLVIAYAMSWVERVR